MEIKSHLDATEVFIADLIACSTCFGHHYAHHQELKSIIQWLLRVVFHAVVFKLLVWCGAEGYVSGLQDAFYFHILNIILHSFMYFPFENILNTISIGYNEMITYFSRDVTPCLWLISDVSEDDRAFTFRV